MERVIGVCSLCGGEVMGFDGIWMSVTPPPPARCSSCGATEARGPVIQMTPRLPRKQAPLEWRRTDSTR